MKYGGNDFWKNQNEEWKKLNGKDFVIGLHQIEAHKLALSCLEEINEIDNIKEDYISLKIYILRAMRNYNELKRFIDKQLIDDNMNLTLMYEKALNFEDLNEYDSALKIYKQICGIDDKFRLARIKVNSIESR